MTRQLSSHAAAAKCIRKELKAAFPYTKFSVTSESFSMGDAVRIHWTDGPTSAQVDAITGKYQYGDFDGMIDLYEITNRRHDIPQSKYVQTTRHQSNETTRAIAAEVNARRGFNLVIDERTGWVDPSSDGHDGNFWHASYIHQTFHPKSLVCRECSHPTAFADAYCGECGAKIASPEY